MSAPSEKTRSAETNELETDLLRFRPISSICLEMIYQREVVDQMRNDLRAALEKLKQTNPNHPLLKDFESAV
jgi:hypothetical protein